MGLCDQQYDLQQGIGVLEDILDQTTRKAIAQGEVRQSTIEEGQGARVDAQEGAG